MKLKKFLFACSFALLLVGSQTISAYSQSMAEEDNLVLHNPIHIVGNENFIFANGVVGGSGAEEDPYIIENWIIENSGNNGIWIENTDSYFIIRNCSIEDSEIGIKLENVSNGIVENNYFSGSQVNICLFDSSLNTLNSNYCEGGYLDIFLLYSENNAVKNNTCSSSRCFGVFLSDNNMFRSNFCENFDVVGISLRFGSSNNVLRGNVCENGRIGIELSLGSRVRPIVGIFPDIMIPTNNVSMEGPSNNTLSKNVCENNRVGIKLYSSSYNTLSNNLMKNNKYNFQVRGENLFHYQQDIDTSNLVDGEPVYYLVENEDEVIDPSLDLGYLALVDCDNISVKDLVLNHNGSSILLAYTEDSQIENCTLTNNKYGIELWFSKKNRIKNCTLTNNKDGIRLSGNKNLVMGNECWNNSNGIDIAGKYNTIKNNDCGGNSEHGIKLLAPPESPHNHNEFVNNNCEIYRWWIATPMPGDEDSGLPWIWVGVGVGVLASVVVGVLWWKYF